MPLQIRRGTQAERDQLVDSGIPLAAGEPLWETTNKRLYVGDGATAGGVLLEAAVDLSEYSGTIEAEGFIGPITGNVFDIDSNLLVDAVNGSIVLSGTVKGDIIPDESDVYDIGSSSKRFRDLWLSDSLWVGQAQITAVDSTIDLPLGSTIGGAPVGGGVVEGQAYRINIAGDDSTIIVNALSSTITALSGSFEELTVASFDNGSIQIFENTISALPNVDNSINFQANESPGTQLRLDLYASGTVDGDILTGIESSQRFDIKANGGTSISPEDIASGDLLGVIGFSGFQESTAFEGISVLGMQCDPVGTTTDNHIPTKFFVINQPSVQGGDISFLTFDSLGRLAVNQQNAQATLDVNGFMKLAILSQEPDTLLSDGMIAIADGIDWDPLSNGKQSMVVRLGGTWVAIAASA
jgi:hypothetical protein